MSMRHSTSQTRSCKLQDQSDSIKSRSANLTKTVHVLVGTYELLPFRNLSGQLSRRSVDIHFPRYRADRREDYLAFQSVLFTFQRHLPLEGNTDLLKHFDFCYETLCRLCWSAEGLAYPGFGGRARRKQPCAHAQASRTNSLVRLSVPAHGQ